MRECAICGAETKRLAEYKNLPAVAQHLPTADNIGDDKGIDIGILQCPYCDCLQLDAEPVVYYREAIRTSRVSGELLNFKRKQFECFAAKYDLHDKRVVEIGCGGGEFLQILKSICANAEGIEYSGKLAAECCKQGLAVRRGFIEDETCIYGEYDGFIMLNFLEHLPNPKSVLRGVSRNLSSGAVGIVEVPNADMICNERLYSEFMRDHLFYYSKRSLTILLNLCGFDVIEKNSVWHDYVLNFTVRKRLPAVLAGLDFYRQRIGDELDRIIDSHEKVAVWGASHEAFFILTCSDNADQIACIYDSSPIKQGKYSPVSHIPIFAPPDTINADAVIVLAASYSDEVVRSLRDERLYTGKIYTFKNSKLVERKN